LIKEFMKNEKGAAQRSLMICWSEATPPGIMK
jgi:hypothetical protein